MVKKDKLNEEDNMKNNAIVEQKDELVILKPDFIEEIVEDSALDIGSGDLKISYISLCQSLSDAVGAGNAQVGDFIDTLSGENLGKEINVIVLKHEKMWIKYDKRVYVSKSRDGNYWENGEKMTDDEKWQALQHNFWVLIRGKLNPIPSLLSFRSSSFITGKDFLNLLFRFQKQNKEATYARVYTIGSEKKQNEKGFFMVKNVKVNGFVTKEEYEMSKMVATQIRDLNLSSKIEIKNSEAVTQEEHEMVGLD